VEDRSDIRDDLAREFHASGARVLPAANANEAIGIYRRRAFEVAALVTDVRLENESEDDVSGISLAKQISELSPSLPLFGVTAFDLRVGEGVMREVYKKTVRKSPLESSVYKHIENIVGSASKFDEDRFAGVPGTLLDIKRRYGISAEDFATLISNWRIADLGRLALLSWHDSGDPAMADEPSDRTQVEGKIRFVPAGTSVSGSRVALDVAVVMKIVDGLKVAELFGMPLIYTYAEDEDEAISILLEYLQDCHKTMGEPLEFAGSNMLDIVRFRYFLDQLFRPSRSDDDLVQN